MSHIINKITASLCCNNNEVVAARERIRHNGRDTVNLLDLIPIYTEPLPVQDNKPPLYHMTCLNRTININPLTLQGRNPINPMLTCVKVTDWIDFNLNNPRGKLFAWSEEDKRKFRLCLTSLQYSQEDASPSVLELIQHMKEDKALLRGFDSIMPSNIRTDNILMRGLKGIYGLDDHETKLLYGILLLDNNNTINFWLGAAPKYTFIYAKMLHKLTKVSLDDEIYYILPYSTILTNRTIDVIRFMQTGWGDYGVDVSIRGFGNLIIATAVNYIASKQDSAFNQILASLREHAEYFGPESHI